MYSKEQESKGFLKEVRDLFPLEDEGKLTDFFFFSVE